MHISGVAAFCFGTILYSLALIRLARILYKSHRHIHDIMDITLLLGSLICVFAFSSLWFDHDADAYIPEHMAYIFFLLFFTSFIVFHPPDLTCPPHKCEEYDRAQCIPLLLPTGRTPVDMTEGV